MNYLRERAGFLIIGFIGLAIIAFVVSDALRSSSPFLQDSRSKVGTVAGENISYQEFNKRVEQNLNAIKEQSGGVVAPQMASYANEQTWQQMVQEIVFKKQVAKTGVGCGAEELFDMVQGKNPDPQIRRIFTNPQTGEFDPKSVLTFLHNKDKDPNTQKQWNEFEKGLQLSRSTQKYMGLITGAMYTTSLEMNQANVNNTKTASIKYLTLNYASVADASVKVSDDDIEKYYNENKYKYKQKEDQRTFEYVVINVTPSKEDTLASQKDIEKIAADFKASTNDSLFYAVNADTKMPLTYMKKGQLSAVLDSNLYNASVGTVYGPYFEDGAYKVAKLLGVKNMPDSVKARHILIGAQKGGLTPMGIATADSLKKMIQSGKAKFADLAKTHSDDPGSGSKGGELGFFSRGMMVPQFEDAVFNGKPGDIKIVQTQFGTHLIEIEDQKNTSKAVKIAVVDRVFSPSQNSRQTSFAKANNFLASVNNAKSFSEAVEKAGLTKRISDNIGANAAEVTGLGNSREVVRWAFRAKQNDVSEVFDVSDKYVVAHLIQIREKGYVPLEYVKSEIEVAVRQAKKAEQLAEKAKTAMNGASSIDAVAAKLGTPVQVADGLTFNNPVINGVGQELNLMGSVFGSTAGKLGKVVKGDHGVFVYMVQNFGTPAPIADVKAMRNNLEMMQKQIASQGTMDALQDKANIKDNRAKFY
ncbi:peptidylprolyl isomerase [Solitalea koreensis]|uniref:Periplasmic chaperone PpiD n=1 Tax=Solitalea koreensis TaxID=543615 RepID=A0A521CN01_9SPHI|nr:SurA N-terminal domain-containing protein [Solitalea koreensis]SMO60827.1 peptidyl-prolyl cis-trans isomerase D [Solitalea koreensis]